MSNQQNKLYRILLSLSYDIQLIKKYVPTKFLRSILIYLVRCVVKYRVIGLLESYSIEQILYEFAIFSNLMGLTSNKLAYLRKEYGKNDDSEYGIDYKVITNNKEMIIGIKMTIWTKDKLAKLNLDLIKKFGKFVLDVSWAYKNDNGVYVLYNRTEEILNSRKEIKELLVEYISKYCMYFLNFCEKISPSR